MAGGPPTVNSICPAPPTQFVLPFGGRREERRHGIKRPPGPHGSSTYVPLPKPNQTAFIWSKEEKDKWKVNLAHGGMQVRHNGYPRHPALQGIVGYVLCRSCCSDDILRLGGNRMALQEEVLHQRSANV
ncbi:hypothetical protein SRHO_G00197970 [Serrasalmus rhombeus]